MNRVTHLGADHTVTGSCHLLQMNDLNVLVDCGMAQGEDSVCSMKEWSIPANKLDFVFITHAHIDHMGRLPELIENGFSGEIIATHATKALILPMLTDAMDLQGKSNQEIAKLGDSIDEQSWGFEYDQDFDLEHGVTFTLGQAGHILGSCHIHFVSKEPVWSVVFSGDLGAKDTPILPDPTIPEPCDLLILESTYGNRVHEDRRHRVGRLADVLRSTLSDDGKVFIPGFALGRTQELIYEIDRLFSNPDPKSKVPVFVDSPLGLEITKIYSHLSQYWDKESKDLLYHGDHPIDFDELYAVRSYQDHIRLLDLPGPHIIIAGSGMCTGGRILDHLISGLGNEANDVFFVGYQAKGTPGSVIIHYGKKPGGYVYLNGEKVPIKAKIHTLTGYSAHADQNGLVEWVESMEKKPKEIKLVHGEPQAQKALAGLLEQRGYTVIGGGLIRPAP